MKKAKILNKGFTHQNFLKKISGGFTLIELLVVVALIAVLSGIVLTSTSASRSKGANAGVKTNLRTILAQAELIYIGSTPSAYGTANFALGPCAQAPGTPFGNDVIWAAILETQRQAGGVMPTCAATPSSYAVSAKFKLPDNASNFWCIDSQGSARGEVNDISGPACN